MNSELIECCLLTDIFRRSQESLQESTKNLLEENQKETNNFTLERIKEFTGGTQRQLELTLGALKDRNLLCQECIEFSNNFITEAKREIDNLIVAEQIRKKLWLQARRAKPLQETRIFEILIHLENVSENGKKEVAKLVENGIPWEHKNNPIFIKAMWTRLVSQNVLDMEKRLKEVEDKLWKNKLEREKLTRLEVATKELDNILSENSAFITYRKEADLKEKLEQADLLLKNGIVNLKHTEKIVLSKIVEEIKRDYLTERSKSE